MFFFSNLWRYSKLGITGTGAILALAMLIGGIVIGTSVKGVIIIIGGSIFLVQSAILFFDNSKIQAQMKKHIDELEDNIDEFESQNMLYKANVQKFIYENRKLATSLNKSHIQLEKLSKIKDEYQEANDTYKNLLEENKTNLEEQSEQVQLFQSENQELKVALENMESIQSKFSQEIAEYCKLMESNEIQIGELEAAKNDYLEENEKLRKTNQDNQEQLHILQIQVDKLKQLYSNSLELLDNLRQAGDLFTNF